MDENPAHSVVTRDEYIEKLRASPKLNAIINAIADIGYATLQIRELENDAGLVAISSIAIRPPGQDTVKIMHFDFPLTGATTDADEAQSNE